MTNCWNWEGTLNGEYGRIGHTYAHRLYYRRLVGEIPLGMQVNHHCDNPRCVNPEHLFLGTQRDNILDAMNKGRITGPPDHSGERSPSAKLS